jgi:isoleucyl-tRNA synthetase
VPFISEEVFKWLTAKESVHLEYFPEYRKELIDEKLNSDMDKVQKIINLWLALRAGKKLRVRQPLASITIWGELSEYYVEIIKEELNVKEVLFLEDMSSIAHKICKPNARLIGPKFWSKVQDIIREAKSGNFTELDNWWVKVGEYELMAWEFEIAYEISETSTADIQAGFWMVIAMDTMVTEALLTEWYTRDIIRSIQDARKEAGYNVSDRISLNIIWEWRESILNLFKQYIESETLSQIDFNLLSWDISKDIELDEVKFNIIIKR